MSGTITVTALAAGGNENIKIVFTNCAPFTNCMSQMDNTQIDNAKDIDVVMLMYSKTSGRLWQYCRDEPALTDAHALDNFSGIDALLKFKQKWNIAIIIQKHQEVYGNTIEMNQLYLMLMLLIIFLVIVLRLNLNKK